MSKTKRGQTDINPEDIESGEECATIAELMDYFISWYLEEWNYERYQSPGNKHNQVQLFFILFREQCANYDAPVPDDIVSQLRFDLEDVADGPVDYDKSEKRARMWAEIMDRHVFREQLNRIEEKLDTLG